MSDSSNTRIDELLDDVMEALDHGVLPISVIADDHLYRRELERIFTRAWVFVGHESEIPSRGDYVQRYIGPDAFVLVRGEDGVIRLLFDACRHRGQQVCRSEKGNASHFRCSYHGWTYRNTGELTGAPLYKRAYGNMDKGQWGLLAAPHIESIHGFVFASLDPDAPPFEEYLGEMKWYFDLLFGQSKEGWEVIGEPQRWVVECNWKIGAENSAGDDYHLMYLHRSLSEMGLDGLAKPTDGLEAYHIQASNGHAISHAVLPPGVPDGRFWSWPEPERIFEPKLGQTMYDLAERSVGYVGTIFPNLMILSFPLQQKASTGPVPTQILRLYHPRSAHEIEVMNWILAPKGLSPADRLACQRVSLATFGSAGMFDQDDTEPFEGITRTSRSEFARKVGMRINYQMGMPDIGGVSTRQGDDYHPGPGVKFHPGLEEGVMRGFWRRWAQFLRPGGYPTRMSPDEQNGSRTEATVA